MSQRLRVIVTRPRAQAQAWVERLRALGIDAQALPLIEIAPPADPAAVAAAWRSLRQLTLVMFVSANAVEQFFALKPPRLRWPEALRAGATGPGTTAALRQAGLEPSQIVAPAAHTEQFDSEALWRHLSLEPWRGRKVLVVRGEDGRDWLAERWREKGAEVSFVAAYRRQPPRFSAAESALLAQAQGAPAEHLWLFSSSEAVGHLRALLPQMVWVPCRALATHARIAETARGLGFGSVDEVAPTIAAVAARARSVQSATP